MKNFYLLHNNFLLACDADDDDDELEIKSFERKKIENSL